MARRSEHHRVAGCLAVEAVRCRVGVMIGFDLDDGTADAIDHKCGSDEIRCHIVNTAGEEACC
jgi:hypothetical protein